MNTKPRPEISVIIIGYNAAKSLPALFKSLKNQSADSNLYELIFIDDCSGDTTDNTWESTKFSAESKYIKHKKR